MLFASNEFNLIADEIFISDENDNIIAQGNVKIFVILKLRPTQTTKDQPPNIPPTYTKHKLFLLFFVVRRRYGLLTD